MTMPAWFCALLSQYNRIAITGGPRTGKTTLAAGVKDRPVFGSDESIDFPWADVPAYVMGKAARMGERWVIEGVQVPRALRKGLTPDVVVHLEGSHVTLTEGQESMTKATTTVLDEWVAGASVPVVKVPR